MANKIVIIFLLLFTAGAQAQDTTGRRPDSPLREFWHQIDDIFNDINFSNAHWGVVIQSLKTGEYFYKRNEDKLVTPASNNKLFTTAAGLIALGSDFRYETPVYALGEIDGSILKGDLIVQGSGDPTFSGRFYNNDMFGVFNKWADSLLNIGIDEISGNIIGDDNSFEDKGLGNGWSWDYESFWYAAPSGALSFNDNCIDITVVYDKREENAVVKVIPSTRYVIVMNNVNAVPADSITSIDVYRERGTNVITVFGTLRQNDTVKTYCTINNPTQYTTVVFKDILERRGITVRGYAMDIDDISVSPDYSKLQRLFTHYSVPLRDIVKVINKNSHNLYAEQLLKTIGLEVKNFGSYENGVEATKEILEDMGINPESIIIADGSGLSRLNMVTPRQITTLLTYMYNHGQYVPFYNSLPVAGVDGTLANRMKNTRAEGRIRAKSGFLGFARSLSGYAITADNEPVVFSIIANNFNVPVKLAENLQDLVCLRLANFSRKQMEY
jgi:serine-type D-Ala-D-Ala carboxypeptidase/endopeptidase (penicillin-binding protein 4)